VPTAVTTNQLLAVVRDLVAAEFGPSISADLDEDSPLLTTGLLSSLSLVELQARCEEAFGTTFDPTDLGYDNGDTVRQLAGAIAVRG
jgi:acyl carrier protein